MNVPKLRFKEFIDDWKSDKISNLTTYVDYRGKTPVKTATGIFLITAKNVKKGYIDYNCSKEYVEASQYNAIMHRGLPKVGDVLVTTEAPCGNVAQIDNANVALAQRIIKYRGNDLINNDFLKYELLSDYFQTELKRVASGGTVYGVKGSTLHQMSVNYCSKEEQTKIAQFLSLLDKKIELQTKKIEALKLFKKGLLNSFFQNRQPNVTIENCISYGKAGGTPSSKNKDYYDGNIPFLSISDMTSQKKYILKTEKSISQQGIKNSSAWIVPKKSIILSMYASYGLIAINKIELATSQAMFSMIVNSKNNIEYIYYYLEFLYNNNYYDRLVSIGTQANLNADKVKKIKIYLSDINSQNKISKILKLCDERMEYENKKEFELRKFKQGLLQNMFI